jgi:predicted N-acetyltransferase YhbS
MTDGVPRGATPADRDGLRELVGKVFRATLMDEYPQLFHDANLENCRIVVVDGKVVSNVGMTIQDAAIFGNRVTVACIGAVSTDPDYRGRGYASACFADAMRVAREKGVDFMMISGDRKLYRMAGCRGVGPGSHVELTREIAETVPSDGTTIRVATCDDIPTLGALHRAEPVHWIRPPETWKRAFDCSFVMNRLSEFVIVERNGQPWGYFILARPERHDASPWVSELAGDRRLLLSGLAAAIRQRDVAALRWHVPGWDRLGQQTVAELELPLRPSQTSGTYLITNFAQLGERLRPYLSEFVGDATANAIGFQSDGDAASVELGDERFRLPNRGCAAHFLFGTLEERPTPAPSGGRLADVYRAAFPVPALWYGVNYV